MTFITQVKDRLENGIVSWLQASLGGTPEFTSNDDTPYNFFGGRRSGAYTLPCTVASCNEATEEIAPGSGIFRARVKIVTMTGIDETNPSSDNAEDLHATRTDLIANYTRDISTMKSQVGERGSLNIFGIVPLGEASDIQGRMFVDTLDFDIFCQSIA